MKRMLFIPVALLTLLGSACSSLPRSPSIKSLADDDYSLAIEYLQRYLPAQMKKRGLTGVSAALVDGQQLVWSEGFGFADKDAGTRATKRTAYGAGSVSKLFTALAVVQLAEQRKLDLDAPITDSVPEFGLQSRFGSIDEITLRNILSHHAGIPGNIIDGMWTNEPQAFTTVTTRLNGYYAAFAPNTVFAYSNAGYSVAGHAVQEASSRAFTDYMDEAVLRPLGMTHSNFRYDRSGEELSRDYWKGDDVESPGLRDLPAGGLISTVGDLSQLIKLVNGDGFLESRFLEAESLRDMLAIQEYDSALEPNSFNGIGWFHFSRFLDDKYSVVGHTGQTMAHSAILAMAPDLKLGVVLLANSPSNGALEEMTDEILRVAHAVKTGRALSSIDATVEEPRPLQGTQSSFHGHYASSFGQLNIVGDGDTYDVMVGGRKLKLIKQDKDGHVLRARLLGFIPVKPPNIGELSFFAREVNGERLIYARNPAGQFGLVASQIITQPRDSAWDARLGEYTLTNPIETEIDLFRIENVSLRHVDGFYQLSLSSPLSNQELPLKVINESEAILQGYGRGLGETVIAQEDGSLLHAGLVFVRN